MVLAEEPLCRECAKENQVTAATDVDHIDGNVTNTNRENLQPLCSFHHKQKTARENGAFGRPKFGI
jgi:5-methylcytosine-specific restriction protein A